MASSVATSSPHSSIGQISSPSSTGSASRYTPHMVPISSSSPSPRHPHAPSLAPVGAYQSIPENEPWKDELPMLSPMIPPGEGGISRTLEYSGEELLPFHHYNSQDIVYEQPRRKAKIVGGKYLKGEQLGEGSYSRVKEMLDVQTLCRRAVKIMKQRRLRRIPNGEANVQREIKILKRLKHKNIVNLIETFEDTEKQKLYVVLEYCVGGLQEMLDKAPHNKFPVWQAHRYFVQLMEGLEYIHSQGVVHKDIKPGNLLLTASEEVKITDFGVAEELDRYELKDLCQTCQGSPAFQPPEIASGCETWSGFKADIWAAGVTLFHFTTGKFPFEGENVYKLFGAISTGVFEIPADLTIHLQDLLRGMLKKDSKERFSIQDIRSHAWFIFKYGRPLAHDLVRFTPYDDSEDLYRGTTVLPYLENFYQYGTSEEAPAPIIDRDGPDASNWPSEHDLFDQCEAQSMNSVQSVDRTADRSADNIIQLRSRVSSQENVLFPMSRSVDGLGNLSPNLASEVVKKKTSRKTSKMKRLNSKSSCSQQ